MYDAETIHRYPRWVYGAIEVLCLLLVMWGSVHFGATLLRYAWDMYGLDQALLTRIPFLIHIVDWIDGPHNRPRVDQITDLIPALAWVGLMLLAAVILRNAFPIIRTGAQGLLVEFGGDWVPIPWEALQTIKSTSDVGGEHFVLLVQTNRSVLTGWHRLYSLLYGLRWGRGFWVTSHISEFNRLVKVMLSETDRIARILDKKEPTKLDERSPSWLFRFLLSPTAFFGQRAATDLASEPIPHYAEASNLREERLVGNYPRRITLVFTWGMIILMVLTLWQYLLYWVKFLALVVPFLRRLTPFNWAFSDPAYVELANAYRTVGVPLFGVPSRSDLPVPAWLLIEAHLMVFVMVMVFLIARALLPVIEARAEGLAIRSQLSKQWYLAPWSQIVTFKATEFSEQNQVLLIQTQGGALPLSYRFNSLFYDGSFAKGVIVTSAISNFQPIVQRALFEVTNRQSHQSPRPDAPPLLQQEAHSWLLWLAFKTGTAFDQLIDQVREDNTTRTFHFRTLMRAAGPMIWLSLPLVTLALLSNMLLRGSPPGVGILFQASALWLISMLEWPVVCLVSILMDEAAGGAEEGYRVLYIYPLTQLPRLLPLIGALLLVAVNVPVAPLLLWIGALAWSFVLAASLWELLYGWRGSQALLGGLLPVLWQLLGLLVFILIQR